MNKCIVCQISIDSNDHKHNFCPKHYHPKMSTRSKRRCYYCGQVVSFVNSVDDKDVVCDSKRCSKRKNEEKRINYSVLNAKCSECFTKLEVYLDDFILCRHLFCCIACANNFFEKVNLVKTFGKCENDIDIDNVEDNVKKRLKEIEVDKTILSYRLLDKSTILLKCQLANDVVTIEENIVSLIDNKTLPQIKLKQHEAFIKRIIFIKNTVVVKSINSTYKNDYGLFDRPTFESVFMQLALSLSERSTCLRNNVGAVITDANMSKVHAIGYNGDAMHGKNQCESLEPGACNCIHAEVNALTKADNSLKGCVMFTTVSPCVVCAKLIINKGIDKVIYYNNYRDNAGIDLLLKSNVCVSMYDNLVKYNNQQQQYIIA